MATTVEVLTAKSVPLGGPRAMTVHRALPQRQRSFIGAWCFIDHFGPDDVSQTGGMDVAPHPHTGLQTVTWLFEGTIMHDDAGDVHEVVRPGTINLMTAGAGTCHSEVSTQATTTLHGVQLWTVLPEEHRFTQRRFDSYTPPNISLLNDAGSARVFLGSLLDEDSPVPTFSPLVGAEFTLAPGAQATWDINPEFEHGIIADTNDLIVEGTRLYSSDVGYTGVGETSISVKNESDAPGRFLFIGGAPLREDIIMWWNLIGRSHEEVVRWREEWENHSERFGVTEGYVSKRADGLARLPAPPMPTTRLKPRKNPEPIARKIRTRA